MSFEPESFECKCSFSLFMIKLVATETKTWRQNPEIIAHMAEPERLAYPQASSVRTTLLPHGTVQAVASVLATVIGVIAVWSYGRCAEFGNGRSVGHWHVRLSF
jgi:hypothetical protein